MQGPIVILFLICALNLSAQTPFIENYTTEEYVASTQNWAILEDQQGLMYFGNNEGVLEYDGINWRLIKLKTTVRSLAMDSAGTIYVGAVNEFGRLVPDEKGDLEFESLTHLIPNGKEGCKDVWRIRVLNDMVFFCSFDKIFRLKDKSIEVYLPKEKRFSFAFLVKDKLYVHEEGRGLLKYNNGVFDFLPETEIFEDISRVYTILPYGEDQILIGTRNFGFSLYSTSENKLLKIPESFQAASDFFSNQRGYSGLALAEGGYLIGTSSVGMIHLSPNGEILGAYSKENGLQDNSVYKLEQGKSGLIWCALSNGISSINLNTPFKVYTALDGIDGTIFTLSTYKDDLYIGTNRNSFRLNAKNQIHKVEGTGTQNWYLKDVGDQLLLAHNPKGLFEIKGTQAYPFENNQKLVGVGYESIPDRPDYLIAGAHQGFFLVHYENKKWGIKHRIEGFDHAIYSFSRDKEDFYWVRSSPNDLYRIKFNESLDKIVFVKKYNTKSHNLDTGTIMAYKLSDDRLVFGSDKGAHWYNRTTDEFEPYPLLKEMKGDVGPIFEDSKGNIWYENSMNGIHSKGVFIKKGSTWNHVTTPFHKFDKKEIYKGASSIITEDQSGNIIFGTTKGLVIYDPSKQVDYDIPFNTLIRKIYFNDETRIVPGALQSSETKYFPYSENSVKFDYAATFYEENNKNTFSYRLLGRNDEWSDWTLITSKEYTNLPEGKYTFEVKSKNLYQKEGRTASFTFNIAPPWYRSTFAYLGYFFLFAGFVYGVTLWNSSRLRRQNEILEQNVQKRTAQLKSEKEKTEQLLKELDDLNQTKDRIFAIMGHDLRKPAIAFRGIAKKVNYLLKKKDYATIEKIGASIERNAYALNVLIDNLLNWALTQKNTLPHQPEYIDLEGIIDNNILIFDQIAQDKNIELTKTVEGSVIAWADMNALLTIVRNLVDNALKYTPKGGAVVLSAFGDNTSAYLEISDTGLGMKADQLEDLFKLKKNKSEQGTEGEKGIGLGLHLVHELIKINKGEISVISEVGKGTVFKVALPREKV